MPRFLLLPPKRTPEIRKRPRRTAYGGLQYAAVSLLLSTWCLLPRSANGFGSGSAGGSVVNRYLGWVIARHREDLQRSSSTIDPYVSSSLSDEATSPSGTLEITPASEAFPNHLDSGSSTRRNSGSHRGSSSSSSNSNNPAEDPAFLRKRTASLLALASIAEFSTSSALDEEGGGTTAAAAAHPRGFKPDKKAFHFLMDAWAFSSEPDAADQAAALLDKMEFLHLDPDVRSYTKAMNAFARSAGRRADAGDRAADIFRRMAFKSSTRGASAHPNTFSYTAVVEAYANSAAVGSAAKADEWCREMVRTFQKGDSTVVPTSRAFHAVITGYAKSGEPHAGRKAQDAFDLMERMWEEYGVAECRPTNFNYNSLITAWANCPDEPGSAQQARRVLQRMEELYQSGDAHVKPTTVTFNAVIDAYAKAAEKRTLEDDSSVGNSYILPSDGASAESQAEELLRHMEELHRTGENADARPNVRSFNSVLNVWAKSGREEGADRAQEILALMENLYQRGNDEVRPDVHSFCTVINAWARSSANNKADWAMNLFREMKQLYRSGNHEHLKPNVVAYNAVLNACAFCNPAGEYCLHQSSRAMEMAHAVLKELDGGNNGKSKGNEFGVKPDQVTYGTFLKVCANQLPDCSTRQQIVEMIFKKCQRDGQVGNLVLQQLKAMLASDPDLYQKLVGKPIDAEVSMDDLPSTWRRNVVEGKWRRKQRSSWN